MRWLLASEHQNRATSYITARNNLIYHCNTAGVSIGGYAPERGRTDHCTVVNITKDHKNLRFAVDSTRYSWSIGTETLTALGRYRVAQDSLMTKDEEVDVERMVSRGFRSPVAADAMADAKG